MSLANRVAIVTGGGRGLGQVISFRLARAGAAVVVAGRETADLERTREEIRHGGGIALALTTDVSNEAQVARMAALTEETYGRIDILVNNAGIMGPTKPVMEITRAEWDEVFSINLTGAFLCTRAVLPRMSLQKSGKIINISSVAGKLTYPLRSPYAASKSGLIAFTRTLAREVGPYNIQVNAICPGPVEGENIQRVIKARAEQLNKVVDTMTQEFVQRTVLGRMVSPGEVADLVVYLTSANAHSITGQAIDVDAGYTLS